MKKELLVRFITKYRLNGIINEAVWKVSNGTLRVQAMGWNRKLFVAVTCRDFHDFDDAEIGILDTKKLLGMLKAIPSEHVALTPAKYSWGDVAALMLQGDTMRAEYVAANPKSMDGIPKLKNLPRWNAIIMLDDEFRQRFFKAFNATEDKQALFTVAMSERTGALQVLVSHHADGSSGGMCLHPNVPLNMKVVKRPISFSAYCLCQALKANPEFKEPFLLVSDAGLATIKFSADDMESRYYLVQIEVED